MLLCNVFTRFTVKGVKKSLTRKISKLKRRIPRFSDVILRYLAIRSFANISLDFNLSETLITAFPRDSPFRPVRERLGGNWKRN